MVKLIMGLTSHFNHTERNMSDYSGWVAQSSRVENVSDRFALSRSTEQDPAHFPGAMLNLWWNQVVGTSCPISSRLIVESDRGINRGTKTTPSTSSCSGIHRFFLGLSTGRRHCYSRRATARLEHAFVAHHARCAVSGYRSRGMAFPDDIQACNS